MTFASFAFRADFIARQNLNPIIAIGISRIAKNTENRIMEIVIINNRSGMAIKLGTFEEIRMAQRC